MNRRRSTRTRTSWWALLGLCAALATWRTAGAQVSAPDPLAPTEEEEAIAELLAEGEYAGAVELAQPLLAGLLEDISDAYTSQDHRSNIDIALDWQRFRMLLGRVCRACTSARLPPGEAPSPAEWVYAELALALATRADELAGDERLPWDVSRHMSQEAQRAASVCMRSGESQPAGEALALARALLDRVPKSEENWRVQSQRVGIGLAEAALAFQTTGTDALLRKVAEAIQPYRDTDWIVRRTVSVGSVLFDVGPVDLSLRYDYLLLLEEELRGNEADSSLPRLYEELGDTARRLGRRQDAIHWYETFLELAPQHHLAPAVRQLLAIRAGADGAEPQQSSDAGEAEPPLPDQGGEAEPPLPSETGGAKPHFPDDAGEAEPQQDRVVPEAQPKEPSGAGARGAAQTSQPAPGGADSDGAGRDAPDSTPERAARSRPESPPAAPDDGSPLAPAPRKLRAEAADDGPAQAPTPAARATTPAPADDRATAPVRPPRAKSGWLLMGGGLLLAVGAAVVVASVWMRSKGA